MEQNELIQIFLRLKEHYPERMKLNSNVSTNITMQPLDGEEPSDKRYDRMSVSWVNGRHRYEVAVVIDHKGDTSWVEESLKNSIDNNKGVIVGIER